MLWQTPRTVTEAYRVWVPGKVEQRPRRTWVKGHREQITSTVGGRSVQRTVWVAGHYEDWDAEVPVPGHYEDRVRTVRKWVTS
jgi:hypothetical protein